MGQAPPASQVRPLCAAPLVRGACSAAEAFPPPARAGAQPRRAKCTAWRVSERSHRRVHVSARAAKVHAERPRSLPHTWEDLRCSRRRRPSRPLFSCHPCARGSARATSQALAALPHRTSPVCGRVSTWAGSRCKGVDAPPATHAACPPPLAPRSSRSWSRAAWRHQGRGQVDLIKNATKTRHIRTRAHWPVPCCVSCAGPCKRGRAEAAAVVHGGAEQAARCVAASKRH